MNEKRDHSDDDGFLDGQRRDPRPEFARSLRARLRAADGPAPRPAFFLRPAFAGALAVAAFAASFAFPAVRATAQQVLDLFRVHEFAVVRVDEDRVEKLKSLEASPEKLFGANFEKLQDPGEPRRFADAGSAERAVGFAFARPSYVPSPLRADSVFVQGEARARVTVAAKPIREMMDLMDVRDLELPANLDGQKIEARIPSIVVQTFRSDGRRRASLVQAESPEVALPPGVDLPRLGEIGLRLIGVEANEAHRLANAIDWRSTVIVPVLPSATSFQQVTIGGQRGVMLQTSRMESPGAAAQGPGTVLLWTKAGRVYALMGNFSEVDLMQMAESVR